MFHIMEERRLRLFQVNSALNEKEPICTDFAYQYYRQNTLTLTIPLIIVGITYIAKTILRIIASYEKPQNLGLQMISSAINMFLLAYFNVGLVLFLVNFNIGADS